MAQRIHSTLKEFGFEWSSTASGISKEQILEVANIFKTKEVRLCWAKEDLPNIRMQSIRLKKLLICAAKVLENREQEHVRFVAIATYKVIGQ